MVVFAGMSNWLDDLEQKKREEDQAFWAGVDATIKEGRAARAEQEKHLQLIRPRFEPIYAKLDAYLDRAKRNGFFLWTQKNEFSGYLRIFRLIGPYEKDAKYLQAEAYIDLSPKLEGIQLSFTIIPVELRFVKKEFSSAYEWRETLQYGSSKLMETIGTVPYDALTDESLLDLVKWIATGVEPIPKFSSIIPYTPPYKLDEIKTRGCLLNPWYYLGCGLALLIVSLAFFLFWFFIIYR